MIIIEDEPFIAMDLERLVQELGHRVVRVARTERRLIGAVKKRVRASLGRHPAGGRKSGLDAVNEFLRIVSVPVIFVTAYPERLLTGTKPEPTFLISKPFKEEALKAVISQALFFDIRSRSESA